MDRGDIDIAYVLEDVPGVLGVYAVRGVEGIEHAVHVEPGGFAKAQAHYAVLRVRTHAECEKVRFFETELPGAIRTRATRLILSVAQRAEARSRVPATSSALEQQPTPAMVRSVNEEVRTVLVVDMGTGTEEVARATFRATIFRTPAVNIAVKKAHSGMFDLILCDERSAFGRLGFLASLARVNPILARRVILVLYQGRSDAMRELPNRFVVKPLAPGALLLPPDDPELYSSSPRTDP